MWLYGNAADPGLFLFDPFTSLIFNIFLYASVIVLTIGIALTFKKAGEEWWKALIPFYCEWTITKIARAPQSWFWTWLVTILVGMIPLIIGTVLVIIGAMDPLMAGAEGLVAVGLIMILFGSVLVLVSVVFWTMILHRISKAFGQDVGFTVGLFFLEPVFFMILGLNDRMQYQLGADSAQMHAPYGGVPAGTPGAQQPYGQVTYPPQDAYAQAPYGQQPSSGAFPTAPPAPENPGGLSKGAIVGYVLLILVPIFACCMALEFFGDLMNQATMSGW